MRALAWAIFNDRTRKLVGTRFPQLFGSKTGAADQAVGCNERPVRVLVIPIVKTHGLVKR